MKHQLQKFASIGIDNITQNKNSFSINYENFSTDFILSDFLYKSDVLERKLNISSLAKMNFPIDSDSLNKKLSKENAQLLLNLNIESITEIGNCETSS